LARSVKMVHVVKFDPIYKERIWGGRNLERLLGRRLPPGARIGESWELADLPEDKSRVASGPSYGRHLGQLVQTWGKQLLGSVSLDGGQFPLLVKFLDANDVLSVQVHPDYASEAAMGGSVRAKYEAWYVIWSRPDAFIYRGFKKGVTLRQVERSVKSNELADLLVKLPAQAGDWFYLPGGTVHALGAGVVVAEVQTPSDTTFRLYDWQRVDSRTGRPRALHIDEGLRCLKFDENDSLPLSTGSAASLFEEKLVEAPTFILSKHTKSAGSCGTMEINEPVVWIVLEGAGSVGDEAFQLEFERGDVVLVPAGVKKVEYTISSECTCLQVDLTNSD